MNNKINRTQRKKWWYIVIPMAIVLFIVLSLIAYYFKTDHFSGISAALPLFMVGFILFALFASTSFALWVYEDCKERGDDGILWAAVVLVAMPLVVIYFLRRSEIKQNCCICSHKISTKANYCEKCGSPVKRREVVKMEKKTHHLKLIVAGILCTVLTLSCLTGFVASAMTSDVNTNIASDEKVWNKGIIVMSYQTNWKGIWKLNFKSASPGFIRESKCKIEDPSVQKLYADITCGIIPKDATLTLWIVQGDIAQSVDVTNLEAPLVYPLDEFAAGNVRLRLQINGVEDVTSEIYIK